MALVFGACCAHAASLSEVRFDALGGGPRSLTALKGKPAVLVFWRSDCAPCLIELRGLAGLQAAAAPAPLVTVALEGPASAAQALRKMDVSPERAWLSRTDARLTLLAFGPAPPRLPLSVALDSRGAVCARHVGLLGTDRVRQWVKQCR
ncbi:MAG: thioredoxin-family protein [Phenylobacterium sp.]|jgi:thiol-disulfide isomerase/thioredoxin|uniref:TlpA family protein disulfide reductase n=1 Tax=Phenylobacterium sp. TaxID=1871053 RepID=UPI00261C953E|nr:redoxin domain-containing protein [Phenylobacterium sp.]MDB5464818.1 thioredoxin-family protein [Phenylobacterium sp.]